MPEVCQDDFVYIALFLKAGCVLGSIVFFKDHILIMLTKCLATNKSIKSW